LTSTALPVVLPVLCVPNLTISYPTPAALWDIRSVTIIVMEISSHSLAGFPPFFYDVGRWDYPRWVAHVVRWSIPCCSYWLPDQGRLVAVVFSAADKGPSVSAVVQLTSDYFFTLTFW